MIVFRIAVEKYAHRLQASGVANRWNKDNEYVLYTSENRSLAILELVAHRNVIMANINYKIMTISIPDHKKYFSFQNEKDLPDHWKTMKLYPFLQEQSSNWYHNQESLVLKVPSVLIPREFNYIINTRHPDFTKASLLETEDFSWDKRLL